jgi:hypothetical protein
MSTPLCVECGRALIGNHEKCRNKERLDNAKEFVKQYKLLTGKDVGNLHGIPTEEQEQKE